MTPSILKGTREPSSPSSLWDLVPKPPEPELLEQSSAVPADVRSGQMPGGLTLSGMVAWLQACVASGQDRRREWAALNWGKVLAAKRRHARKVRPKPTPAEKKAEYMRRYRARLKRQKELAKKRMADGLVIKAIDLAKAKRDARRLRRQIREDRRKGIY